MNRSAGQSTRGVVVIGVGNEFRSDDALGIVIARELRRTGTGEVTVMEASGEGAALIEAWKGARTAIIVDAVRSGAVPGSLHHVDLSTQDLPLHLLPRSSHLFGVAEAVATARTLGQLPPHVIFLGIEGGSYEFGVSLSDSVLRSVPTLLEKIALELKACEIV